MKRGKLNRLDMAGRGEGGGDSSCVLTPLGKKHFLHFYYETDNFILDKKKYNKK